jgi:tetratricopeptide (TPR) repeat protein
MSLKTSLAVSVGVVLIAGILYASSANAQGASTSSLADQLKAQYKLAKIVPELNGYKVAEPGTMLVIQKEGIVGVPLGNKSVDPVTYAIQKDNDLHHSNSGASTWKFGVGHKVYVSKLDLDAKHEKVSFTIVECDSSNPVKPSYYKSIVDFGFPNGYLAGAEVEQIEDVISQVLTIDNGTIERQRQARDGQRPPEVLTNDDLIKMVQAKVPDSVIVAKIRSSKSEFDTSADALINLKHAGVSDAVLEAMTVDLAAESNPPAETPPPNPVAVSCGEYASCMSSGSEALRSARWDDAIANFRQASSLDPSKQAPLALLAMAYLTTERDEEAASAWDKILQIGQSIGLGVCRERVLHCDEGNLFLSSNEVSFRDAKNQSVFAVPPSEVTSLGARTNPRGSAPYFNVRVAGKNYNFYFFPLGIECSTEHVIVECPQAGMRQQIVVDTYVAQTIPKLAAGQFAKKE